eukprot:TRINITY_DN19377_c0_g1_i1.p1 TRINITY_DN19377_c0_g1~~TRINITY_DN19377_c0_g1_i1.p1  ORF type:complete len:161 (+),score=41.56 TRINITY_DN19377_c0_g1_i1:117-599(+)
MATLNGNKWNVDNVKTKEPVTINITENKQSVDIFKAEGAVIIVKGKCTSITINNCKKTGIVFDDVIASVEVVNSNGLQLQSNGTIPNISIDKSQGVQVYIQTEAGKQVQIVTCASTEVNVVTPGATENDDPKEQFIPNQFISTFDSKGVLVTKPSEHVGV